MKYKDYLIAFLTDGGSSNSGGGSGVSINQVKSLINQNNTDYVNQAISKALEYNSNNLTNLEDGFSQGSVQGIEAAASGNYAFAEGYKTKASGDYSHAEGQETQALGSYSHAEGWDTQASGYSSHSEGQETGAYGGYSHSEGYKTLALGYSSHSEGSYSNTIKEGRYSLSLDSNDNTKIITSTSLADTIENEKWYIYIDSDKYILTNIASDRLSFNLHSLQGTTIKSFTSFPSDYTDWIYKLQSVSLGSCSHSEGDGTIASGDSSHAEGIRTEASSEGSHSEGQNTIASGDSSHSEGRGTTASGNYSHAEGRSTTASGQCSHTEGYKTKASGLESHAQGNQTTASGSDSHAEGIGTTASGDISHAEGNNTIASGNCSHAGGSYTIASGISQTVIGQYNIEDTVTNPSMLSKYIFIIGNGTYNSRSNALAVDWNGNIQISGTPTENNHVVTKQYVDTYNTENNLTIPISGISTKTGIVGIECDWEHRTPVSLKVTLPEQFDSISDYTVVYFFDLGGERKELTYTKSQLATYLAENRTVDLLALSGQTIASPYNSDGTIRLTLTSNDGTFKGNTSGSNILNKSISLPNLSIASSTNTASDTFTFTYIDTRSRKLNEIPVLTAQDIIDGNNIVGLVNAATLKTVIQQLVTSQS